jgi:glutamate formiminotransferase/formiminotetrahydrofolate cyclodeaminase
MNLTNYRQTPIARVVELVRREAARYGASVRNCELVGLVPQEALVDAAVWYTQLDMFDPTEQVLETRLHDALASAETGVSPETVENSFLEAVAKGTPSPGGGSASAHAGALGAALVAMVGRLTMGKKKYADVESQMWEMIEQAESLRGALTHDVQEDSAAFEAYLAAVRLPKDTPEQQLARAEMLEKATLHTIHVPLGVAQKAIAVLRLAIQAARQGNVNTISDAASGAALARAAFTGSSLNVRINCPNLSDQQAAREFIEEINQLDTQAKTLETELYQALAERGKLAW